MALVMCELCKKAFFGSFNGKNEKDEKDGKGICPDCDARLRELYPSVRSYLRDCGGTNTAFEVSKALGISIKDVYALASMGFVGYEDKYGSGKKMEWKIN